MIYVDPLLPRFNTPTAQYLRDNPVRFGKHDMALSPTQWEMVFCTEKFPAWVGGTRSGKTIGGVARGLKHSLWIPQNRGIVGRLYQTDLEDTTQRDFYEIAEATGMVKKKNDRELILYNCDHEGRINKNETTSEILFLHFDNPNHLKGHGVGWFWMDEGSEMTPKAFYRLVDRLSHKPAEGKFSGWVTSNPEGRNWIFDEWYNKEKVERLSKDARLMRRGIHNRTKDNPFLTPEYLKMQYAMSPPEWIRRYMDGEFDVFEGQIFSEFDTEVHCVRSNECKNWDGHEPPVLWPRRLGIDTGGVDPWAFEASAVDPWGNLIFYDEIYRPEVYVGSFERELSIMMANRNFVRCVMDWENKTAQEELRRIGLVIKNAIKRGKILSLQQTARYLHPNPERAFPPWHPKARQPGSPGIFFTERVPHLVSEVPQQRWKKLAGHDIQLNEMDTRMADHATHAMMYTIRECPKPEEALVNIATKLKKLEVDDRSRYYYQLEMAEAERKAKLAPHTGRANQLPFRRRSEIVRGI